MENELQKRLLRGFYSVSFLQLTQILIRIAETPLFLFYLGVESYGQWLILMSFANIFTISDLGFAQSVGRQVSFYISKNDFDNAKIEWQSGIIGAIIPIIIISICAFFLISIFSVKSILGLDKIADSEFRLMAGFLIIAAVSSRLVDISYSMYYAVNRYPLGNFNKAIFRFCTYSAIFVVLIVTKNIFSLVFTYTCGEVLGAIYFTFSLRKIAPWFCFNLKYFKWKRIRSLISPSIATLSIPAGQMINYHISRLIIGSLLGPSAVSIFTAHRQLARLLMLACSYIYIFEPEMSAAFAVSSNTQYRIKARKGCKILLWFFTALAGILFASSYFIFPIWTSKRIIYDVFLFTPLLFTTLFESYGRAILIPISAINKHLNVAAGIFILYIFLPIYIFFVGNRYGLHGIAYVILFTDFFVFLIITRSMLHHTSDNFSDWLYSIGKADWLYSILKTGKKR